VLSANTHSIYKYFLIAVVLGLVAAVTTHNTLLFVASALLLLIFVFFIENPELPLAIMFNGTLFYFYALYKLGFQPSRILTGAFYFFLVCCFLLPDVILFVKKKRQFNFGTVDLCFLCFFLLLFLSYLAFSTGNKNAYKKIAYAPLLAIAPYLGSRFLHSEIKVKKFLKYSAFVAIVLIIPAFYGLLCDPVLSRKPRFSMYLFEGMHPRDNPILFGTTYTILLIIILVWLLEYGRFRFRYLIPIELCVYLILRAGSRGVLLSFAASMILYLFVISKAKPKLKLLTFFFTLLLFLGTYKLLPRSLSNFYQYSVSVEAWQHSNSSIKIRTTMWKQAIRDFTESPLLGVGTGNSVVGSGYPHNIILEVCAELGLLGIVIFILMCYLTWQKAISVIKKEGSSGSHVLMKLSLVLFLYSLIHAMFSGQITSQTRLFITMGLICSLENIVGKSLLPAGEKGQIPIRPV